MVKVSKGHGESGHYLELNFSVEIFSAEIFSAEIFTAEPSLRCGTFTAELTAELLLRKPHCGALARKFPFSAFIENTFGNLAASLSEGHHIGDEDKRKLWLPMVQ